MSVLAFASIDPEVSVSDTAAAARDSSELWVDNVDSFHDNKRETLLQTTIIREKNLHSNM